MNNTSLKPNEIEDIKSFMKILAEESKKVIKPYFTSSTEVNLKIDESPVTKADIEAETTIRRIIEKKFPEHSILGEEQCNKNADTRFKWVIDPIDGTKSFINGSYDFGTCVALLENGKPIIGMICQPILDLVIIGDCKTTELNGKKIQAKKSGSIKDCTLLLTDQLNVGNFQNPLGFNLLAKLVCNVRTWGNCFGYVLLAQGYPVIMVDPIMAPWDIMALIPIIQGAGGIITDYQGNDPITGRSIVACSKEIHKNVIDILNCKFDIALDKKFPKKTLSEWQKSIKTFVEEYNKEISIINRIADITSEVGELVGELSKLDKLFLHDEDLNGWYHRLHDEAGDILYSLFCLANDLNVDITKLSETVNFENNNFFNLYANFDVRFKDESLNKTQNKLLTIDNKIRADLSIRQKDQLNYNTRGHNLVSIMGSLAKSILLESEYGKKEIFQASEMIKQKIYELCFGLFLFSNDFGINLEHSIYNAIEKYTKRFLETENFSSILSVSNNFK